MQSRINLDEISLIDCEMNAVNPVIQMATERGKVNVYSLMHHEATGWYLWNHKTRQGQNVNGNMIYEFAILMIDNTPQLRLSQNKHYSITHGKPVFAAGEIHFEMEDGLCKIKEINDQSGSYIYPIGQQDKHYVERFHAIIEECGLPVEQILLVKDRAAKEIPAARSSANTMGLFDKTKNPGQQNSSPGNKNQFPTM